MNPFKIDDRVKPRGAEGESGRRGVVIEVRGDRCRVHWSAFEPRWRERRTWLAAARLEPATCAQGATQDGAQGA